MNQIIDVRVANNGRLLLPKSVREALGVTGGGAVVLSIEGDVVKLTSITKRIKEAQALYRQYVANDLAVDDFIHDRRSEASSDKHD